MVTPRLLKSRLWFRNQRKKHVSAASGILVVFFRVAPQVKHSRSHLQIDEIQHRHTHTRPARTCLSGSPCKTEMDEAAGACSPPPPPPGNTHTLSLFIISCRIQRRRSRQGCVSEEGDEQTAFRRWARKCKYTRLSHGIYLNVAVFDLRITERHNRNHPLTINQVCVTLLLRRLAQAKAQLGWIKYKQG